MLLNLRDIVYTFQHCFKKDFKTNLNLNIKCRSYDLDILKTYPRLRAGVPGQLARGETQLPGGQDGAQPHQLQQGRGQVLYRARNEDLRRFHNHRFESA